MESKYGLTGTVNEGSVSRPLPPAQQEVKLMSLNNVMVALPA